MWKKISIIIILFCLFAVLQSSFFVNFNLFGAVPNLIFVLFFTLCFLDKNRSYYYILFMALFGGFLLDIFSYSYLGPSVIILIILGLLLHKTQSLLADSDGNYPFIYFMPMFVIFLVVYYLLAGAYSFFIDSNKIITPFGLTTLYSIIYNCIFAIILYFLLKNIWPKKNN